MARTYTAKMVKIESESTNEWRLFMKSNYWGIRFWNVVEEVEGEYDASRKTFAAASGRQFDVRPDYSGAEKK